MVMTTEKNWGRMREISTVKNLVLSKVRRWELRKGKLREMYLDE